MPKNGNLPRMDSDFYRKAFFLVAAVLLGYALLRMLDPFWGALSWGLCLAFLLHPLQRRLTRRFKGRDGLAAGLLTGLTPIVLLLPLASLGIMFVQQVSNLIQLLQRLDMSKNAAWFARFEQYPLVARAAAFIRENSFVSTEEIQGWLVKGAQNVLQSLAAAGGNVVLGAVGTLVGFFLMLFLLFFLLRDGAAMFASLVRLIPMSEARRAGLLQLLADTTRAVVYGSGTTALAQGTLVGIGFAIVGLPSPVVFGALASILALLPAGGTAIVWVPAVLWLLAMQRWGAALFLGLWGFGVSLTDNLLRPLLIGRYAPVSTLAVFVGVVGGVSAFGAIGLIVGPVLLTLIAALLKFADEPSPQR
jgi:predicted PurR-regulated permease PerM